MTLPLHFRETPEGLLAQAKIPMAQAGELATKIAALCDLVDHHADVQLAHNELRVRIITHSEGRITELDHALAKEITALSTQKWAVVTGGRARLGQAIAKELQRVGYKICITTRNRELLNQGRTPEGHLVVELDLLNEESVASFLDRVHEAAGSYPKLLVHNASAYPVSFLDSATEEDWMEMAHVHAMAPLKMNRDAIKHGVESIVYLLDSRVPWGTDKEHAAYLWSKKAAYEHMRMLALAEAPHLRVNAVAPGAILPPSSGGGNLQAAVAATPRGRVGTKDEVARAVRFVAEHDYLCGQTIYVDGGRHLVSGTHSLPSTH